DVLGRAGVDDVAGHELEGLGQLADLLRHRPDHHVEVGVLLHAAVDLEPDRALGEMADRGRGLQRSERRRAVEALAYLPWLLLVAHRALQVAARRIEGHSTSAHA